MKKTILIMVVLMISIAGAGERIANMFKKQQMLFERVRQAYADKEKSINAELLKKNLKLSNLSVVLIAYKQEKVIELWVSSSSKKQYVFLKSFDVCAESGTVGPKRKQGDMQVPEGFYHIDRFNPASNFHLSLGINYPNPADKIQSKGQSPGGDIFIHGNCVSIGCMAITDDRIKELYIYALEAANYLQSEVPVYIFPCRIDSDNWDKLMNSNKSNTALTNFWTELRKGYKLWELNKRPLAIQYTKTGEYVFK